LYDNGKQTAEKLVEIGGLKSKDAFYQLKKRQEDKLSVPQKEDGINYYDITDLCRNIIEAKIKDRINFLKREEQESKLQDSRSRESEEFINECKSLMEIYKKNLDTSICSGIVYLDFEKICEISPLISEKIIENPRESLAFIELAIEELGITDCVEVRIQNVSEVHEKKIETIRSKDLDKMITIRGRIMQLSDVRPEVVSAKFECPSCGTIISVLQDGKKFTEPTRCSCGRRGSFRVVSKNYVDSARIILEDLHEKSDNPLSKRLNCFLKGSLTSKEEIKKCFPGNEVLLTGILIEVPVALPRGGVSNRFDLGLEINNVELSDDELSIEKFTEEEVEEIQRIAAKVDNNGLSEISKSFCPDVYGHDSIKQAILLFLMNKRNDKSFSKTRFKPNICIIGDPGTAKSIICNEAVSLTPNSRKQTGGSASAVGLTASAVRDDYTGGWTLQPGALVLAKEFTFLDEINNLGDDEKPKLQEAMSEQEINVAKASIQAKLSVTGGILACANPKNGIFDPDIKFSSQFNIPLAIVNRFDLMFIVRDEVNGEKDRQISKSMIRRHRNMTVQVYNSDTLKKYLFYVRNSPEPEIDDKIEKKMIDMHERIRKYKSQDKYINSRVQESIIRMATASAKSRLSKNIEEKDLVIAANILSKSHYQTPEYKIIFSDNRNSNFIDIMRKSPDMSFTLEDLGVKLSDIEVECRRGVIFEESRGRWRWN
jgi:replicative DNA helicase Mcm